MTSLVWAMSGSERHPCLPFQACERSCEVFLSLVVAGAGTGRCARRLCRVHWFHCGARQHTLCADPNLQCVVAVSTMCVPPRLQQIGVPRFWATASITRPVFPAQVYLPIPTIIQVTVHVIDASMRGLLVGPLAAV